jgi:hypothetical protein
VDDERAGRAEPHQPRVSPGRQHQAGEHRLVGELGQKDQREDRNHDAEVHRRIIAATAAASEIWWDRGHRAAGWTRSARPR